MKNFIKTVILIAGTFVVCFKVTQAQDCNAGSLGAQSFVCNGSFVIVLSSGIIINDGSSIVYVLHNGTNDSIGSNVYATATDGVFTNDGNIPTNVNLCISCIVGNSLDANGIPLPDGSCYDISNCHYTIFLDPIEISAIEECDANTGTYTVQLSATGGGPEYFPNHSYSLFGDLNGELEIGTVNTYGPFNSGESYSFEVTGDGKGCNTDIYTGSADCNLYDLALIKTVSSPGPFSPGDDVLYTITVYNQGNMNASSVEITDYIPSGMSLSSSDNNGWSVFGSSTINTIPSITSGGTYILNILLTISDSAPVGNYVNYAEISGDDGDDIDSTPDLDPNNDVADEDDHDLASITIGTATNVWPGDINLDGIVNNQDDAIHYLYYNYNNNNIPRQEQGILWQPYPCPDWGFAVPETYGNDIKHFDCDGNGFINIQDKNAILLNWGETHDEASFPGAGIYTFGNFPSNNKIYLQPSGDITDDLLIMDIVLEHINGIDLEMFGGFFTVEYPTSAFSSANVVFVSSWLGFPNVNLNMDYKDFPAQQKVEIGFSRTNETNTTGSGIIGQIAFTIDNTNLRQNGNAQNTQIVEFDAINVGAHNNTGNPIAISNQYQPVNIGAVNCESSINISQATPFQNLYKSNGTINTNSLVIIGQNQQVQYNANRVTLTEGFSVRAGADFKVRSSGCN